MSEKVRYFLEQSVKEIQDLRKRKLFTQDELTTVMKRRTEYEHRLISRSVRPSDFLGYARYEMRMDRLRYLRQTRLHIKPGMSDWAGQRRITFILERGTRRFPGDLSLWTALVDYARSKGSVRVANKALASMLRLHPTNPDVWVYVAKYQAEENSAMAEARAVLQRGLKFNADSEYLWLEYMRLELIYVAKILARRKILGVAAAHKHDPIGAEAADGTDELSGIDIHAAAETELRNLPDVNIDVLGDPQSNPALRGDVALTVFDAGSAVIPSKLEFARHALSLFDDFEDLDRQHLCGHVVHYCNQSSTLAGSPEVQLWTVTLPIRHIPASDPTFPDQFRLVMGLYGRDREHSLQLKDDLRSYLADKVGADADPALRKAVELFVSKL